MNLETVSSYKVLLMGDAIYDRYIFVGQLGKSIKEPVLSVMLQRTETYKGGVWAAAEHVRAICNAVDIYHGKCVMMNTRFVESIYNRKLFTLHERVDDMHCSYQNISDYDLVIVCDFGHGTMSRELIAEVSREARFLAVNVQTNSSNYGFNLVTKYPRADFVVLDELEARLAAGDRHSPIEEVIHKLGFGRIAITLGANGAVGFDGSFHRHPAMAENIIDTLGAGDAFLSVSSPFACAGFPMADILKVGNAAGAAKVKVIGHRRAVTRGDIGLTD